MRRALLVLIALSGVTFFAGLGRPAIADSDEAYYAEAAREMVETGDWLTPHYNYEYRFQKPILYYWLSAAAYLVTGVDEAAARFPAAMSGLGLVLITYFCARRWTTERTATLAGVMVATSFGYFAMARQSLPDLPLAFFVTAAIWTAIEGVIGPIERGAGSREPAARRPWLIWSAASLAGGFLTKGPVAILLFGLVLLPVLLAESQAHGSRFALVRRLRWTDVALASAVFLILAAPWYGAMVATHGSAYLTNFLVGENVERFATDRFNEPRTIWFYGPIVLAGMLPWSLFVLLGIAPLMRVVRRQTPPGLAAVRLSLWAGLPLLFFSASIGKQPRYILPILPPLAILLAMAAARGFETGRNTGAPSVTLQKICGVLSGTLLIVLGALIFRASPLLNVVNPGWIGTSAAGVGTAGIVVVIVSVLRHTMIPGAITVAGAVTLVALHYGILSRGSAEPVQEIASAIAVHRSADQPIGAYQVFVRNLVFYTRVKQVDLFNEARAVEFIRSPDQILGVFARDDLDRLERSTGVTLRRLESVRYFNAAGLRLRMLLWPEPDRDVDTVFLVTNK